MKNNQKGFISLVLIGAVIVIVVIGGYFVLKAKKQPVAQQVPVNSVSEIANWKTYTNSQYGFEFQYSKDFSIHSNSANALDLISNESCKSITQYVPWPQNCITYDLYIKKDKTIGLDKNQTIIKVAGYAAERTVETNKNEEQIYVQFSKGDVWYTSWITYDITQRSKATDILNQILSTFKFTEPITVTDTANWKTYTNSQYGFEVRYPQTWSVRITPAGFFDLPDDKAENGKGIESLIHDNVVVSVDNSKKYSSLSNLENSFKSDPNWNDSSISQKKIGNNNFLVYGWMHQSQGVDYFTLVNGNSLEIRFEMNDTILPVEQSKNYPDFLKLLTTLKFTK